MSDTKQIKKTPLDRWLFARGVNRGDLADACKRSRQWLWNVTTAAHVDEETRAVVLGGVTKIGLTATESEVFE